FGLPPRRTVGREHREIPADGRPLGHRDRRRSRALLALTRGPAHRAGVGVAEAAGNMGEVRVPERPEAGPEEEGDSGVLTPMSVKEVLEYIARNLVDDPDAVSVTETKGEGSVVLRLSVAAEDMGKVIGRQRRT